jgi:hypothetical protein
MINIDGTLDNNIVKRCCNVKLLKEKCVEYNKKIKHWHNLWHNFKKRAPI